MQPKVNHKILCRNRRKSGIFGSETTTYCGRKNQNHIFAKTCTNIGGILYGVFVHYAQKSMVLRWIGAIACAHTATAATLWATARSARDEALCSVVVINHYHGENRRDAGESAVIQSTTTYSTKQRLHPQDLVCAICTDSGSGVKPQDIVSRNDWQILYLAEFARCREFGSANAQL